MDDHARELYYGSARDEMLPFVPPATRRMLEVGCAWGRFSEMVKARLGLEEAWGIEMDPEIAAVARPRLDHVIVRDVFAALDELPVAHFDCVVFNDVLEHMVNPWRILSAMRRHLAPGGAVVASIPNVRYFGVVLDLVVRGNWNYADCGVLDRTHVRFFTRSSIREMFEDAGYEVLGIDGVTRPPTRLGRLAANLFAGRLRDMRYPQFACRARLAPRPDEPDEPHETAAPPTPPASPAGSSSPTLPTLEDPA